MTRKIPTFLPSYCSCVTLPHVQASKNDGTLLSRTRGEQDALSLFLPVQSSVQGLSVKFAQFSALCPGTLTADQVDHFPDPCRSVGIVLFHKELNAFLIVRQVRA